MISLFHNSGTPSPYPLPLKVERRCGKRSDAFYSLLVNSTFAK